MKSKNSSISLTGVAAPDREYKEDSMDCTEACSRTGTMTGNGGVE